MSVYDDELAHLEARHAELRAAYDAAKAAGHAGVLPFLQAHLEANAAEQQRLRAKGADAARASAQDAAFATQHARPMARPVAGVAYTEPAAAQGGMGMRQRLLAMLDVVALVKAVRHGMAALDRPSALLMFVIAGLGAVVSGGYTWVADWLPTWKFANGEFSPEAESYLPSNLAQILIGSADQAARQIEGMAALTLGGFIGGCIAVGVTLFPTILQFIAPRVVHPAAAVAADISIWFDFVTDFPQSWAQAGAVAENPIGRLLLTLVLVLIYSLLLQTIFVLCLTAFVTATWVLVRGDRPTAPPAQRVINL